MSAAPSPQLQSSGAPGREAGRSGTDRGPANRMVEKRLCSSGPDFRLAVNPDAPARDYSGGVGCRSISTFIIHRWRR
jgi:hypothetical protein